MTEPEIVTAYSCPSECGELYEEEDEALDCCEGNRPSQVSAFKCEVCGALYTDDFNSGRQDAAECCEPPVKLLRP